MNKIIQNVKDYFIGVVAETKKITWPARQQVINQTLVVIITVVVLALFFALIDFSFSEIVKTIVNWRQ